MEKSFEKAGAFGEELMDSGLESFAMLSKGIREIADDAAEFTRKSFADGNAVLEKLAAAKSPEMAYEIQSAYARSAYEGFIAKASRMTELYADLVRDAYRPFEFAGGYAK